MSKPPMRAPAAPPPEPVPPLEPAAESPPEPTPEPPPAPGSVESADGNEEPEPPPPKELRRKSFGSLSRPLYLKSHRDGFCGGALAVDGVGRIWSESGCEHSSTGFVSSNRLTPKEKRAFDAALAELRRVPDITEYPQCGALATVTLWERNGRLRRWLVCKPINLPMELAAVEIALDEAFNR